VSYWRLRPEQAPATLADGACSGSRRAAVAGAAFKLAFSATAVRVAVAMQPGQPRLTVADVAQDPCQQQRAQPVPARLSGQFEPDSSILLTAGGAYAAPQRPAPLTRTPVALRRGRRTRRP
jgi:hypothetical protein